MLKSEFAELMNIDASNIPESVFEEIHRKYMESEVYGDKSDFCKMVKQDNLLYYASLTWAKQMSEQQSKKSPSGTNMDQKDYEELERAAKALVGHCDESTVLTDAEAKVLINDEFGFEVSRIIILHEAEINVSEANSQYLRIKKVPRIPVYDATDWNYIRFNVRGCAVEWQYEMINGDIYPVLL